MKKLTAARFIFIILVLMVGYTTFNLVAENDPEILPIYVVVIYGGILGIIAAIIENVLLTSKGSWPRKSISLIARIILLNSSLMAFGHTLLSGFQYSYRCNNNLAAVCGGPPLMVKMVIVLFPLFFMALPFGAMTGIPNYLVLTHATKNPPAEGMLIKGNSYKFKKQDRLGEIGLFGIILALPFFILDRSIIGSVILIISVLFLGSAAIIRIRA